MVESKSKKVFYFTVFILPCLLFYVTFCITPFIKGIGISLTNWDGLTPKTPIILEKQIFEEKILSKITDQNDKEYLLQFYSLDEKDNCYKRLSISGMERNKLEKIIKKTKFEPERNKFVGLDNYKKIFTGKIDGKFYPKTTYVKKFTKHSNLPRYISKKEFEKELLKSCSKEEETILLLNSVYSLDNSNVDNIRYKLNSEYDEFDVLTPLWELEEYTKLKKLSDAEIDNFIRTIKQSCFDNSLEDVLLVGTNFVQSNNLSLESSQIISTCINDLYKVTQVKSIIAEKWVVKRYDMGVVGFTLFFAFFSVIGINVVAFALALALDSGIKGQKVLRTVFFLPNVLSMIIVALIWSMLFVQLLPAITGIEKWISDSNKTPWLLVLVSIWQGCGYYMIVYLAGLQNIPVDVIEAAKIDGTSSFQRFRYITLPLMVPSMTISLFLSIANSLKSFDLIYAMIGTTGYATGTVPFVMDIYFDAFSLKQAGLATAKAMVLFVVIVLITGIQLYTMKRKEVEA